MKRGQAAGAAVLLAVIAGLLIMFVVLVQPDERNRLLDGDSPIEPSDDEIDDAKITLNLITESPGRLDYLAQREIEHPLPVINVFTKQESAIVADKSTTYAKKGVFSEEMGRVTFSLADLDNTGDVLLAMNVAAIQGRLTVSLNGEEIFNSEVLVGNVNPLPLPNHLLKDTNELLFGVSSPGLAFWSTNEVQLERIKVVASITDITARSSSHVFLVSETEKNNLERVVLKFQPSCQYNEVGPLTITINGREMYKAVPDCDVALIPLEIAPETLNQGENTVVFGAAEGTYVLSHVNIKSDLKEVDFPTYYFEFSEEQFQDVMDGLSRVRLQMEFVDVSANKFGEVLFNGHLQHFDTKEVSVTMDLSDDVVRGNNAVKIKPRKTLEVRELVVDLVK